MRDVLKDMARCIFIGFKIASGAAAIAVIVALITKQNILSIIYNFVIYAGCIALSLAGITFIKPITQRPLDHEKDWKDYFTKFNIGVVIFFIGLTLLVIGMLIYAVIFYVNP